jgi:hypothetical protein
MNYSLEQLTWMLDQAVQNPHISPLVKPHIIRGLQNEIARFHLNAYLGINNDE